MFMPQETNIPSIFKPKDNNPRINSIAGRYRKFRSTCAVETYLSHCHK